MANARQFMAVRTAAWAKAGGWVNPYVTDGLIAMWDGEWNAGDDSHAPSLTDWYDVSGNGHTAHSNAVASFGNNYINLNGVISFDCDLLLGRTVNSCIANKSFTVECVASGGINENNNAFYASSNGNAWVDRFDFNNGNTAVDVTLCGLNNVSPEIAGSNNDFRSPSLFRGSFVGSSFNFRAIKNNGIEIINFSAEVGNQNNITEVTIGRPSWAAKKKTTIYCIRFYSRNLTADEIAANYAIDKARFGLT